MITCPGVTKDSIRSHYDLATPFYWLFWGRHIHHGFWDADESPRLAQQRLMDRFAATLGINRGDRVLDVGCGMGGSSIHLARKFDCRVTGVTLSPVQRAWASASGRFQKVGRTTKFLCADADAEAVDFATESFDRIWIIGCSEHLFDKPGFFRKAATWLRPGGRIGVLAWLAADEPKDDAALKQLAHVCKGMVCPSLGSSRDYSDWLTTAGLKMKETGDWTQKVARTWEICQRRVERSRVGLLARLIDRRIVSFLDRFQTMQDAYASGAMLYGFIAAEKP